MSENKVRYIHSFSTRPIRINCYNFSGISRLLTQVWYFALSVAYLKQQGAYIVLHTDNLGKKFLEHLPYDEIHLTLNEWDPEINPRFWAAGKFLALKNEKPPFVHIDGDVFLKKKELVAMINETLENSDLIIQSNDPAHMYKQDSAIFDSDKEFSKKHYCEPDGENAYNTGCIGISSEEVRNKICDNYFEIVKHFSEKFKTTLDSEIYLTPDLLAEQKMIRALSNKEDWKVNCLVESNEDCMRLGYQHVYTADKFNDLDKCKETLKIINKDIYESTAQICN